MIILKFRMMVSSWWGRVEDRVGHSKTLLAFYISARVVHTWRLLSFVLTRYILCMN
jgi:hypothetical protein